MSLSVSPFLKIVTNVKSRAFPARSPRKSRMCPAQMGMGIEGHPTIQRLVYELISKSYLIFS